jgi:hypothetical protein
MLSRYSVLFHNRELCCCTRRLLFNGTSTFLHSSPTMLCRSMSTSKASLWSSTTVQANNTHLASSASTQQQQVHAVTDQNKSEATTTVSTKFTLDFQNIIPEPMYVVDTLDVTEENELSDVSTIYERFGNESNENIMLYPNFDTQIVNDDHEETNMYDPDVVDEQIQQQFSNLNDNTEMDSDDSETDSVETTITSMENSSPCTTLYHYQSTDETYFQWDYRYHPKLKGTHLVNTLKKIETTLQDAHLEPYGKLRGVDTVRKNILNFEVRDKFRLGRNKSLSMGKVIMKKSRNGPVPDYDKMRKRTKRLVRPLFLMRAIFKILYERHALYASGYTLEIAHLDSHCLGESFFGPDTKNKVDFDTAKLMLRELWLYGHSGKFNKLQKEDSKYHERLKEKNYRPKLTDD